MTENSPAADSRSRPRASTARQRAQPRLLHGEISRVHAELAALRHELEETQDKLGKTQQELTSTERHVLQSERLSAVGQLAEGVAHELNNPLTTIIGYAHLVAEELSAWGGERPPGATQTAAELARDVRQLYAQAERAAGIVKDLITFAERRVDPQSLHHLPEMVRRVLSLRGYELRANNIELTTDFAPGLPPLLADASQIQQVVLNLVLNAEQAMAPAGRGRLHVGVSFDRPADALVLTVQDDGCGIAAEHLSRIFDPFFSTRPVGSGTGLGLSASYGIVVDHGGHILADSQPGGGTTLTVLLPACIAASPVGPAPRRVLVAHADARARAFVAAACRGWGHRIMAAASAGDAIDRIGREPVDVVVIDESVYEGHANAWRRLFADKPALGAIATGALDAGGDLAQLARERGCTTVAPPYQLAALRWALRAAGEEMS